MNEIINHYDALIDEDNDPVHDPAPLREYMDKCDGEAFIETLQLAADKSVLEIGVGTGRLALRVLSECKHFTGIDVSPKTIERAESNLSEEVKKSTSVLKNKLWFLRSLWNYGNG